eukprot:TRINITY_DN45239_c0_g1_i1.p1 TRINITY_DN45239_c0_g1~~TRINITY_DN45239_c0_g1_i1.p1  ORF type:complete len:652 (+),score=66.21 TRINITY_DN45239_c0_g1_i1:43-1956(+)
MNATVKRARLIGSNVSGEAECHDHADKRDHITNLAGPGTALMRFLADFCESPYDWRFLRAASSSFGHVSKTLDLCLKNFRRELRKQAPAQVLAEASKKLPDGDRVLFALRLAYLGPRRTFRGYGYRSSECVELVFDALKSLFRARTVLGWPVAALVEIWDCVPNDGERGHSHEKVRGYDGFRLVDRGAIELIVSLMERWPRAARVQERGCALMSWLTGPQDLRERCILLIRNAMVTHSEIPELQIVACKALKHFWLTSWSFLLSVEVVEAVCIAMKNHPSSLRVQHAACDFFGRILPCLEKSEGNPKVFETIRNSEAMKLMLSAVTTHMEKPRFQQQVWSLITSCLRHINDCNFFTLGGISVMSATLSKYTSERSYFVSETACFVIQAFRWACTHEECVTQIDSSLVHTVLSALMRDPQKRDVYFVPNCCKAFGHLAGSSSGATLLSEHRVAEHIVKLMEKHLDFNHGSGFSAGGQRTYPVYTASIFALTNLLQRDASQLDAALRTVLSAMSDVPMELKLQERGCTFLASLHWCSLNAVKASAFGACNVVLNAMSAHGDCEELQEQGCLALKTLLVYEKNKVTAAKLDGVGTLMKATEKFPSNAAVITHSRWIIKTMSESAEARQHCAALRLVALVS